jgi:hypothetical protein
LIGKASRRRRQNLVKLKKIRLPPEADQRLKGTAGSPRSCAILRMPVVTVAEPQPEAIAAECRGDSPAAPVGGGTSFGAVKIRAARHSQAALSHKVLGMSPAG